MLKMYEFQCRNKKCQHIFDDLVQTNDYDADEEIRNKCPCCGGIAKMQIGNPPHYKHLSWTTWRQ